MGDRDRGRTAALVTLRSKDLVVKCTQTETMSRPRGEMVGDSDSTANAVRRADRPELVERRCSDDRRLVGADCVIDVVRSTIGIDSTQQSSCTTRVIVTVRFDDVVLDQWARSPTVD
jgi:hypothetical protein